MSHAASIDIEFVDDSTRVIDVIGVLIEAGWRPDGLDGSTIAFFPLGEEDNIYQYAPAVQWPEIATIIEEKDRRKETVGIILTYEDIQGHVLYLPGQRLLSIVLNSFDRRKLPNCGRYTDFSWYVERIVCPLERTVGTILMVQCTDLT